MTCNMICYVWASRNLKGMDYHTLHRAYRPWPDDAMGVIFFLLMQSPLDTWLPVAAIYRATDVWGWPRHVVHGYLESWVALNVIEWTDDHLNYRIPCGSQCLSETASSSNNVPAPRCNLRHE